MGRPATVAHVTEREYLAYDLAHEGKHELVNGEVLAMALVTPAHELLQVNLVVLLSNSPSRDEAGTRKLHAEWCRE